MKTAMLNVNLSPELRRYVKDQVRTGRYQDEKEVVRDAIRQIQQREIEQFERVFGDYPGAPQGNQPPRMRRRSMLRLSATATPRKFSIFDFQFSIFNSQ